LEEPIVAFREISRVLKPGGHFVALTPNRWDYVSLGASLVPNRWHPWLVKRMTGRRENDTFPTHYRANTKSRLNQLARAASLEVVSLELTREHPHYLQFHSLAYAMGLMYEQTVQRGIGQLRPWILGTFRRKSA
jgi:SAM-dependent methyltransferase